MNGKEADFTDSQILNDDILSVLDADIPVQEYENSHVLITGATGFIGGLLVRILLSCNRIYDTRIKVTAMVRDMEKAKEIYGEMYSEENLTFIKADLLHPFTYDGEADYIFHTAAETSSKKMFKKPVETVLTSVEGTDNMLRLAAEKHVRAFIFLSSAEIYGTFRSGEYVTEENLGGVDLKNVRAGYPESKRLCENLCAAYLHQYGVNTVIARPAQVIGAGVPKGDNRISSQLAESVIEERNIILHTLGNSSENFCYSADCAGALLTLGIKGVPGEAYNIVNEDAYCTVLEMAEMVAGKFGNGKVKVTFDIPESDIYGYPPETKFRLSGEKTRALGWRPQTDLEEAYRRLITYIKETRIPKK